MEGITKCLPISELPEIETKQALIELIADRENALKELKDSLAVFIWCTDFQKIKPPEIQTLQWVSSHIDHYIGKQNHIGQLEIFIYKLKLWLQNWDKTVVVKGFQPSTESDNTTENTSVV